MTTTTHTSHPQLRALASTSRIHLAYGAHPAPPVHRPLCGTRATLAGPVPISTEREHLQQLAGLVQQHGQGSICSRCAGQAATRVGASSPLGQALQGISLARQHVPAAQAPAGHMALLRQARAALVGVPGQPSCSLGSAAPAGWPVRVRTNRPGDAVDALRAAGLRAAIGTPADRVVWAGPENAGDSQPPTREQLDDAREAQLAQPDAVAAREAWTASRQPQRPPVKARIEGYVPPVQHTASSTPVGWLASPAGRRWLQRGLGAMPAARSQHDDLVVPVPGLPSTASRHGLLQARRRHLASQARQQQGEARRASRLAAAWACVEHGRPFVYGREVGYRWGGLQVRLTISGQVLLQLGTGLLWEQGPGGQPRAHSRIPCECVLGGADAGPQVAGLAALLRQLRHHVADRYDQVWREDELLRTRVLLCHDYRPTHVKRADTAAARVVERLA